MAMNKKEQAAFDALKDELRLAKALRFTEPVDYDVAIPKSSELRTGFLYNAYLGGSGPRVEVACTDSIYHSFGRNDRTTTQRAHPLYSTRLRALRAMRHEIETKCARILADVDAQIEAELAEVGNPDDAEANRTATPSP
jgi:hypothetical protein